MYAYRRIHTERKTEKEKTGSAQTSDERFFFEKY